MAAGAAAGTVAGPVGTVAGAAVGAVVGGLAGKGVAEMIDPTAEEAYWAQNYEREPYYERGYTFADYHPGYRTGWEGRARHEGRTFDEVERELQADYTRNRGKSRLEWDKNRHAARAAWTALRPRRRAASRARSSKRRHRQQQARASGLFFGGVRTCA